MAVPRPRLPAARQTSSVFRSATMAWSHIRASVARLKLKARLTLAFLGLSALIGICGVVSLVFVQRIGATATVFSDVTSALLARATGLVDNAQRTRAAFLDTLSKGGDASDGTKDLAGLDAA